MGIKVGSTEEVGNKVSVEVFEVTTVSSEVISGRKISSKIANDEFLGVVLKQIDIVRMLNDEILQVPPISIFSSF